MKTEKQVRDGLMETARRIGAEKDLQNLFDKWDRAIALAPQSEKLDMARAAIIEVQNLLDIVPKDGLTINDEVVFKPGGEFNVE
jgi:hypothetical protein